MYLILQEKFYSTADVFRQTNHLPYRNDKKVQYIPSVAEIGAGMQHKAIGDNFHYGFEREDNEKDVFDELLREKYRQHATLILLGPLAIVFPII